MAAASLDPRLNAYRDDLAAEQLRGTVEAPRFSAGAAMQLREAIVPLRRAPGPGEAIDTEALYGERFTVYDEQGGWAWGQLETDGYVGYLPASALGAPGGAATHRVRALRTYIFPTASIKAPPTALISMNAPLAVQRLEGGFAELAEGGFVHAGHLRAAGEAAADFVAVAEMFLGTPYLWGGRSSLGLDCSALVQLSLQAAAIACPRDSDMQQQALGKAIDGAGALRRGDLVFWQGHVGMMGDGETLLHANAHHMAVVREPYAEARARIARGGLEVSAVKRLDPK